MRLAKITFFFSCTLLIATSQFAVARPTVGQCIAQMQREIKYFDKYVTKIQLMGGGSSVTCAYGTGIDRYEDYAREECRKDGVIGLSVRNFQRNKRLCNVHLLKG